MRREMPLDFAGGRKFIVTLFLAGGIMWLCWDGKMTGGECVGGIIAISTLYKASNLAAEGLRSRDER